MRVSLQLPTVLILMAGFLTSGCYTQLQSTGYGGEGSYTTNSSQRTVPQKNAPVDQRAGEIVSEEDYELGYEDGWIDSEAYYFKDYEAKKWYLDVGITLAHNPSFRMSYNTFNNYYSPWDFHSFYFAGFYGYPHWRNFYSFHYGWNDPFWSYYGYTRYPFYGGYYSGGYWGWAGRGYYGIPVVIYNNRSVTNRNYGPRSSGLASRGNANINRTRGTVQNSRSAIRSNARSARVNDRASVNRTNRGTVNRTRSTSTVRNRPATRPTNRGTVNRGSSSSSRSNGTVNRTRSNNRSSGSVNRSSSNRSSGSSANRNRSNNEQSSAIISRSANEREKPVARSSSIITGSGTSAIINRNSADRDNSVTKRAEVLRQNRSENIRTNQPVSTVRNRVLPPQADKVSTQLRGSNDRSSSRTSGLVERAKSLRGMNSSAVQGRTIFNQSSESNRASTRATRPSTNTRPTAVRSSTNRPSSSGTVNRSSSSSNNRGTSSSRNRSSNRNN